MKCEIRDRLVQEVQRHLIDLSNLARQEADLIKDQHENTWLVVDRQIENALGEKERCIGALKQHQSEHGC